MVCVFMIKKTPKTDPSPSPLFPPSSALDKRNFLYIYFFGYLSRVFVHLRVWGEEVRFLGERERKGRNGLTGNGERERDVVEGGERLRDGFTGRV